MFLKPIYIGYFQLPIGKCRTYEYQPGNNFSIQKLILVEKLINGRQHICFMLPFSTYVTNMSF